MYHLRRLAFVCHSTASIARGRTQINSGLINKSTNTIRHLSKRFQMSTPSQETQISDSTDASQKVSLLSVVSVPNEPQGKITSQQENKADDIVSFRSGLRAQPVNMTVFAKSPVEQFQRWFKDACDAKVMMPNSMVLSTAHISNGVAKPSSRAVLLKDIFYDSKAVSADLYMNPERNHNESVVELSRYYSDSAKDSVPNQGAFTFCTNYESRKGQEIGTNAYASLYFIWHELERAVRIEGPIVRAPETLSDHYHHTRPRSSRISAYTSQQSRPIDSYDSFARRYEELVNEFDSKRAASEDPQQDRDVPRPANWGGFVIQPERVEFWQGRPSRTHERLEYKLDGDQGTWSMQFLQP